MKPRWPTFVLIYCPKVETGLLLWCNVGLYLSRSYCLSSFCQTSGMSSLGSNGWYHLLPNKHMVHRPSPLMDFIPAGVPCQWPCRYTGKHKVVAVDGLVTGNGFQEDTWCSVFTKAARVVTDRQQCYYGQYSTPLFSINKTYAACGSIYMAANMKKYYSKYFSVF